MKVRVFAASWMLSASFIGQALAQTACPNGTSALTQAEVVALVAGRTMCAARAPDRWQEFHSGATAAGGPLNDWKRGPGHPVDPTETVGSWSVNGSLLTHNYGVNNVFTWLVCRPGSSPNITLVSTGSSGTVNGINTLAGQVACP